MNQLPENVLLQINNHLGLEEKRAFTQISKQQQNDLVNKDNYMEVYPYELQPGDHIMLCGSRILQVDYVEQKINRPDEIFVMAVDNYYTYIPITAKIMKLK